MTVPELKLENILSAKESDQAIWRGIHSPHSTRRSSHNTKLLGSKRLKKLVSSQPSKSNPCTLLARIKRSILGSNLTLKKEILFTKTTFSIGLALVLTLFIALLIYEYALLSEQADIEKTVRSVIHTIDDEVTDLCDIARRVAISDLMYNYAQSLTNQTYVEQTYLPKMTLIDITVIQVYSLDSMLFQYIWDPVTESTFSSPPNVLSSILPNTQNQFLPLNTSYTPSTFDLEPHSGLVAEQDDGGLWFLCSHPIVDATATSNVVGHLLIGKPLLQTLAHVSVATGECLMPHRISAPADSEAMSYVSVTTPSTLFPNGRFGGEPSHDWSTFLDWTRVNETVAVSMSHDSTIPDNLGIYIDLLSQSSLQPATIKARICPSVYDEVDTPTARVHLDSEFNETQVLEGATIEMSLIAGYVLVQDAYGQVVSGLRIDNERHLLDSLRVMLGIFIPVILVFTFLVGILDASVTHRLVSTHMIHFWNGIRSHLLQRKPTMLSRQKALSGLPEYAFIVEDLMKLVEEREILKKRNIENTIEHIQRVHANDMTAPRTKVIRILSGMVKNNQSSELDTNRIEQVIDLLVNNDCLQFPDVEMFLGMNTSPSGKKNKKGQRMRFSLKEKDTLNNFSSRLDHMTRQTLISLLRPPSYTIEKQRVIELEKAPLGPGGRKLKRSKTPEYLTPWRKQKEGAAYAMSRTLSSTTSPLSSPSPAMIRRDTRTGVGPDTTPRQLTRLQSMRSTITKWTHKPLTPEKNSIFSKTSPDLLIQGLTALSPLTRTSRSSSFNWSEPKSSVELSQHLVTDKAPSISIIDPSPPRNSLSSPTMTPITPLDEASRERRMSATKVAHFEPLSSAHTLRSRFSSQSDHGSLTGSIGGGRGSTASNYIPPPSPGLGSSPSREFEASAAPSLDFVPTAYVSGDAGKDYPAALRFFHQTQKAWDIDMFKAWEEAGSQTLPVVMHHAFQTFDLFAKPFYVSPSDLYTFSSTCAELYHDIPFHSQLHAADVVLTMSKLLELMNAKHTLPKLEILACLIAACIIDVDHPGFSNLFQCSAHSTISTLYNDSSVLENHACSVGFRVLHSSGCTILDKLSSRQYTRLRFIVQSLVMKTDLIHHFNVVGSAQARIDTAQPFQLSELKDRLVLYTLCIKASDLAFCTRPWPQHHAWCEAWICELLLEGDAAAELNMSTYLSICPLANRARASLDSFGRFHCAFAQFVAQPLYACLFEIIEVQNHPAMQQMLLNIHHWELDPKGALSSDALINKKRSTSASPTHENTNLSLESLAIVMEEVTPRRPS